MAGGVNKVILVGNLGKDPETRVLESGAKLARFPIATTESFKDRNTGERRDKTEWHNIVVWRGLADIAEQYLKKGDQVFIEGKIQTRSYEDKEGITKYATDILGLNMTMLGSPRGGGSSDSAPTESAQSGGQPGSSPSSGAAEEQQDQEGMNDLPF